jgi:DeoR/GlpR family transcriptional regulator of sugar metabolism
MAIEKLERRDRILAYIERKGRASIEELCAFLATSEATVRRDLGEMDREGLVHRVHGGATVSDSMKEEPPVFHRAALFAEQKRAIGRTAAALIRDGETVFLGSGSTVMEVARNLMDRRELRVVTNSLPIVNLLADVPEINLVVTGGFLRSAERTFIGFLVQKSLAELRADTVVIGIQGIHPEHGLTDDWLPETMVDRAIVRFAPQLIVVADSSKFGRTRLSFVAGLSDVSAIVTDCGVTPSVMKALADRGVRVVLADEKEST